MNRPICHVRNLRAGALSGYVSEADAIATGGCYLPPDATGWFDASAAHELCVSCVNCGAVISRATREAVLSCPDCGQEEFYVVQTVPPPRRPTCSPQDSSPVPPPIDPGESTNVNPWARWAARMVDLMISNLLAAIVLVLLFAFSEIESENMNSLAEYLLIIPAGLVLDAICYHFFGQTIGKYLFAVRVRRQNGTCLSFGEYLKRNFWVFVKGLGLCIPIVNLITEVIQFNRLHDGKAASYDEGKDVRVVRVRHSGARTFFGVVVLIALFVLFAALGAIE